MYKDKNHIRPINTRLFELISKEEKTIVDLIVEKSISFDFGDRQHVLCYINSIYNGSDENLKMIEKILSNSESYDPDKMDEYLQTQMQVTDWKLYFILRKYGIDVRGFGISVKAFDDLEKKSKGHIEEASNDMITAEDIMRIHRFYKLEFLVNPIVFKNGISILGAERGTGKTRLCLSLAFHIIYGLESFLGYPMLPEGNVLYINMEVPGKQFSSILRQMWAHFDRKYSKRGELFLLNTRDDPNTTIESIGEYINSANVDLVIIDSFKVFVNLILIKEKMQTLTNETMVSFHKLINEWMNKSDITILLTNHLNKGTSSQKSHTDLMYGPGALFDLADHTTLMRRAKAPNERILIPDKSRYAADGEHGSNLIAMNGANEGQEVIFELKEIDINVSDHITDIKSNQKYPAETILKAQELLAEGHSTRKVAEILGIPHHSTVARMAKKLA